MAFEWLHDAYRQLRGLQPAEVHEALTSHRRWPRKAKDDVIGLEVLTIWARTSAGRPLVIAVRRLSDWDWQCLGARDMQSSEFQQFEAWEASR